MGRSVYEQPWNEVDRILSQQGGFQVSKGKRRGAKGIKKGETESKGIAHKNTNCIACPIFVYIVNACNCLNDCHLFMRVQQLSDYVCIIIIGYECS